MWDYHGKYGVSKTCMGLRLNVETLTWDLFVKIGICFVCDHTLTS